MMDIGLLMMPLHKASDDFATTMDEYRAAGVLADQLGFSELWVGEHYSSSTERIVSPLQYFSTLLPVTTRIKFATGVLTLPHHHPARIAGEVAQFDQASRGRFIMGIGVGQPADGFRAVRHARRETRRNDDGVDRHHPPVMGIGWPLRHPGAVLVNPDQNHQ